MRRLVAVAPFILFLALLSACSGDDKPAPTATQAWPSGTWQVEYTRSGGIAGINQRLTVDSTGALVTEDRRMNKTRQEKLAAPAVVALESLLRDANLPSLESDKGLPVPDAILTSIKVASGGVSYAGTFNQAPKAPIVLTLLNHLASVYEGNKP